MKNRINKNDERLKEYWTIIVGIVFIYLFLNAYILPKLPFLIYLVVNIFLIILFIYYLIYIIYEYRSLHKIR
jgi:hypothetical protein